MEPKRHAVSRKGAKAQSPKWNELSFFFASFAPLRGMLLFLLVALTAAAQQVGQNATPEANGPGTIRVSTQLVVEAVEVKDKKGNPIEGLTAKDFTLTENGVPQTISFCEPQKLPQTPLAAPPAPQQPENITIYDKLSRTRITTETPGKLRYNDRRLLALYFDMTAMPPADQLRALGAAKKFIRTQMTAADRVAILRYSGGSVDVLQDFTDDRNRLLSIIANHDCGRRPGLRRIRERRQHLPTPARLSARTTASSISSTPTASWPRFRQPRRCWASSAKRNRSIYFASGLRLNGLDNQAQLHATIDAAIRAGVSFWPIDARGLVAEAPLGDATQGSPGNIGMYYRQRGAGRDRQTSSNRRTRCMRWRGTPAERRCSITTI